MISYFNLYQSLFETFIYSFNNVMYIVVDCLCSRQSSIVQLSTLYEFAEMDDIKKKFGLRVRTLRIAAGYSQEKLAELSDLDRTYIPGIESGKRNVSLVVVEKLARAFNVSISELLNEL